MLDIYKSAIFLTRGDTAYLQFPLYNVKFENGKRVSRTPYEMGATDTLTITVSKRPNDPASVIFSRTSTGSNSIKILPTDTSKEKVGVYRYDVELVKANGDIFTVVKDSEFHITNEETINNE